VGWLQSLWDAGSDILGAVKNFVFGIVAGIISFVTWLYTYLVQLFGILTTWISQVATVAAQALSDAVNGLRSLIIQWFNDAYRVISQGLNDVRSFFGGVIADLRNWAQDALNGLTNGIQDAYRWVLSNVYDPLLSLAQGAWNFATVTLPQVVTQWVHDLEQWATDAFNLVWIVVKPIWDFFAHVLYDAWQVIDKAWDWLVFFATHPISMGLAVLQSIVGTGKDALLANISHTMATTGAHILDTLANYFSV
jgi:phage-related protein